VLSVEAMLTFV